MPIKITDKLITQQTKNTAYAVKTRNSARNEIENQ